jgi:hypothetical protein
MITHGASEFIGPATIQKTSFGRVIPASEARRESVLGKGKQPIPEEPE